jgi:hypothetical protein
MSAAETCWLWKVKDGKVKYFLHSEAPYEMKSLLLTRQAVLKMRNDGEKFLIFAKIPAASQGRRTCSNPKWPKVVGFTTAGGENDRE